LYGKRRLVLRATRTVGWRTAVLLLIAAAGVPCGQAVAQSDRGSSEVSAAGASVMGRSQLDYESFGLSLDMAVDRMNGVRRNSPIGGFEAFGQAEVEAGRQSNVARAPSNEISSGFVRAVPQLALRSNWDNHALNFVLKGDTTRYGDAASEDINDIAVSADGRADLDLDKLLRGGIQVGRGHVPRGAGEDPGPAFEPQAFTFVDSAAAYENRSGDVLGYRVGASIRSRRYDSVSGVSRDTLDRTVYRTDGAVSVDTGLPVQSLLEAGIERADFRTEAGSANDSYRMDLATAWLWEDSDLSRLRARIGASRREYTNSDQAGLTSLLLGLDGLWNVTPLVTLTGKLDVANEETVVAGSSSKLRTAGALRLDYEPRDNLILTAGVGLEQDDYDGIDRSDTRVSADVGVRWLLNEYIFITTGIARLRSDSTLASLDYEDTRVYVGIGAKLCCLTEGGRVDAFSRGF
jgi:hypothetical protein